MPWYTNQKFVSYVQFLTQKSIEIESVFIVCKALELENSTECVILPFKEHGSRNLTSSRLMEQVSWSTLLASQVKLEKSETVELHRQHSDGLETRSTLPVFVAKVVQHGLFPAIEEASKQVDVR